MTFIVMSAPYVIPFPEAGGLVSTFCSGTTKMGKYHDGSGGTYDAAIETNSVECGYVAPPANGTLLSTFCSGTTKMGRYADGNGGTYDAVIETNSVDCGYVAYPPNGTLQSTYCSGTTKMGKYHDGSGGTYDAVIENNSADCGYVPGLEGGGGALRINVQWDGMTDVDLHVTAPDGYEYGYSYAGGGNGVWDYDSTSAGQENVAWNPTAPNGTYTINLINWSGQPAGTVIVTVILNGVSRTVDMSPYIVNSARARSSANTTFTISNGAFTVTPRIG